MNKIIHLKMAINMSAYEIDITTSNFGVFHHKINLNEAQHFDVYLRVKVNGEHQ